MEEKTLLPAARTAQGGKPLTAAAQLRLDHSALAALLVPPPTLPIISAIRIILDHHNPLEEDSGGVYEQCERLVGRDADEILLRLRNAPPVAVAAHVDNLTATESARTALKRAGYKVEI